MLPSELVPSSEGVRDEPGRELILSERTQTTGEIELGLKAVTIRSVATHIERIAHIPRI